MEFLLQYIMRAKGVARKLHQLGNGGHGAGKATSMKNAGELHLY